MNDPAERSHCDEEAARLLPWYLAGRLDAGDTERVARHLERCAVCRDDLAHERAVRALLKSESSLQYAPQPGLAKTLARIDEFDREAPQVPPALATTAREPARRMGAQRWLAAAVLIQAVALGAVGAALFHRAGGAGLEPSYTTLASEAPNFGRGAHIRAVFSPNLSVGELKRLLADHALTIVGGPSDAGAYTLAFTEPHASSQQMDRVIAALRGDTRVSFVEPAVNDGAGRP
ncbi:MAG: zf-HC2 domain-containing protein [Steroidobacteraceae bacterium]|jgi:anti-sigma factor RsiW